jgi:GT2 family glycosyltransferase
MSGDSCAGDDAVVCGRFLRVGSQRFLIRGVSYGTFAPNGTGEQFPAPARVAVDFQSIAELDANTIRTYTSPPEWLLDEASRAGLRVIAGIPWMQHVAFLDGRKIRREIRSTVRREVRRLASHSASLLCSIGNEIPPAVVRWHGRERVEAFLRELYDEAKSVAPGALLTYVNYPPTEFLEVPFFDICSFNVFLHSGEELSAYLARLHHIAGPRPLLISEVGADSLRNGEARQSDLVRMQLQTVLREGACGAVVFSWTDEWWRGGNAVDDWAFGLVDANRRPKRACREVQRIFRSGPFDDEADMPSVSVVVCAYNAADTIDECLRSLDVLNYPDCEVIVVDDGSTDATASIARQYPFVRLIQTANSGLASARNVGLHEARGEIVAYTDADVRVDPEWLTYLVRAFRQPDVAAAGGPAPVPADDHWFAQCVARAPGSPTHVLLDDRTAEHVPGCNCAFRRDALRAIGGFNPIFLRAGDDVDVCWRIQAMGWTVAFAPAALVWHRHRRTTKAYWKQQIGYGEGETWLVREHPDKFVRGRIAWGGHIYSPLPFIRSLRSTRINAGPFGTAAFPSVYRTDTHPFAYLPHSGRWQLAWMSLLIVSCISMAFGAPYGSLLLAAAVGALAATMAKCALYSLRSDVSRLPRIGSHSRAVSAAIYRASIAWLHFVQPCARLSGRLRGYLHRPPGHTPRRDPVQSSPVPDACIFGVGDALRVCLMRPTERFYWSRRWVEPGDLLQSVANRLRQQRATRHIELDSGWWENRDLSVARRSWFRVDVRALVEDHGGGDCLPRFSVRPRLTTGAALPVLLGAGAVAAFRLAGLSWALAVGIVALTAFLFGARSVLSTSRLVIDALHRAAIAHGIAPILPRLERRRARRVPPAPASAFGTTREMDRDDGIGSPVASDV